MRKKEQPNTFEVTASHIKLLRHARVSWYNCEYGAPGIDPKRPYGTSTIERDIGKILGIPEDGYGGYKYPTIQSFEKIHEELDIVLQIVLKTGSFETGIFTKEDPYDSTSWKRVGT